MPSQDEAFHRDHDGKLFSRSCDLFSKQRGLCVGPSEKFSLQSTIQIHLAIEQNMNDEVTTNIQHFFYVDLVPDMSHVLLPAYKVTSW